MVRCKVCIAFCHGQGGVPHQLCHSAERDALLHKPGREAVPERMEHDAQSVIIDAFVQSNFFDHAVKGRTYGRDALPLPVFKYQGAWFTAFSAVEHVLDARCHDGGAGLAALGVSELEHTACDVYILPAKAEHFPRS